VDEAHYVKNPSAQRTLAVKEWIKLAKRTVFLTGTAMENRVEEFRTLVHHLHPQVAQSVSALDGLAGATAFRRAVAPVYLRRNQADVLEELPPRIEVQDWVDLEGADFEAYREAVGTGNFMAMRQAAYPPGAPEGSAKLTRLVEIVEEASSSGQKVVVFSFFRQVLSDIAEALKGFALPQLTGSVSPAARQKIVDDFTDRLEPCAIVSQIQAGGVGLNMQAGSVVILAEPQWKPSMEEQAIARCHRMGQARPVNVHRLLADNSVDQRMLEILAAKSVLFDEYVRRSELKDISPDAVDVSDLESTKEVASQAEDERRIIELEQRRLGFAPVVS
jgi:SNF2 family DNA or RNA helicase